MSARSLRRYRRKLIARQSAKMRRTLALGEHSTVVPKKPRARRPAWYPIPQVGSLPSKPGAFRSA